MSEIYKSPLVTIAIPTYNGAPFIEKTVESVLAQTYENIEILVVDDCSKDDTVQLVRQFDDQRIRLIPNEVGLGAEGNWNKCLSLSRGEYFKLLPQDDLIDRQCIELQIEPFIDGSSNDVELVFSASNLIHEDGRHMMRRSFSKSGSRILNGLAIIKSCLLSGGNAIGEPGVGLCRTSTARMVGGFDGSYSYVIDLDFWFKILKHGNAYYLADRLVSFRISRKSWSYRLADRQKSDYFGLSRKIRDEKVVSLNLMERVLHSLAVHWRTMARAMFYRLFFR